jgi:hypothetical protein
MAKKPLLSLADLGEMGAKLEQEDAGPVQVSGLDDLVTQVRRIADANAALAKKRSDEIVDAIEQLVNVIESKESTDMRPVMELLLQIQSQVMTPPQRTAYRFEVEDRDQRHMFKSGTFTPIEP